MSVYLPGGHPQRPRFDVFAIHQEYAQGGVYLLRQIWKLLGLQTVLKKALAEKKYASPVEWAIFAMVANRALAPDSKRGVEDWVSGDVALGNPEPISLQHLFRAMDFLLTQDAELQKEVFFDTTMT